MCIEGVKDKEAATDETISLTEPMRFLWSVIVNKQFISTITILFSINAYIRFLIKGIYFGAAYSDNVGVEDILAMPFENAGSVAIVLLLMIFAAGTFKFPARSTGRSAGIFCIVLALLGLGVLSRFGYISVVPGIETISIGGYLILYFRVKIPDMAEDPKLLMFFVAVSLLIADLGEIRQFYVRRSKDAPTVVIEDSDFGEDYKLVDSLHSGVIVMSSDDQYVYFIPIDKVKRVVYKKK